MSDRIMSNNEASIFITRCHSSFVPVFQCFRENVKPFVKYHRFLTGGSLRPLAEVRVDNILPTPAKTVNSAL